VARLNVVRASRALGVSPSAERGRQRPAVWGDVRRHPSEQRGRVGCPAG
jgi:hypothetical protein